MPSHSAELERHLLGLLIMYPAALAGVEISPDIFYSDENRTCFLAIQKLVASNTTEGPLNCVIVSREVKKLDKKITADRVSGLLDGIPKSHKNHIPSLAAELSALAQKREIWKVSEKLKKALEAGDDAAAESAHDRLRLMKMGPPKQEEKKSLAEEVKEWVGDVNGEFSIIELYKDINITAKNDRKNASVILSRLVKEGMLRRAGKLNGRFRKVAADCEAVDWVNAPTEPLPLNFPMDIRDWVNIFGGNILVAAGSQNSGKTAFCLNFAVSNQDQYEVHYFTSEMGATETKIRLELMDIPPEQIKIKFWERTDDFEDVIRPEAINIVDFLELNDEFYKVGSKITHIYEKLTTGIALIALQKDVAKEYGRGGSMGLERPRLYLTLNPNVIKIVKAKNWRGLDNPNGLVREFKLVNGWNFIPQGPWRKEPSANVQHNRQSNPRPEKIEKGRFQI